MSIWTDLMGHAFRVDQVDANGVSTRSMIMGEGPPVIFLHGITGHLEAWIPPAPHYAEQFEVHLIDMLGHGYTGKPGEAYTIERMGIHVLDYMDAQGMDKAHLCGLSLGGWVTGWLLSTQGDRFLRSTMVVPAGNPDFNKPEIAAMVRDKTIAAVMSDDREFTRARLLQVVVDEDVLTEELVDVRYKIYHEPEFRAGLDNILQIADLDVYAKYMLSEERLALISGETLIVWSDEEGPMGLSGAPYYVENIPQSALAVFAGCGHWPPYERPEEFAKVTMDFMQNGLGTVPTDPI